MTINKIRLPSANTPLNLLGNDGKPSSKISPDWARAHAEEAKAINALIDAVAKGASSPSITLPDLPVVAGTYTTAQINAVAAMANDIKAKLNALIAALT